MTNYEMDQCLQYLKVINVYKSVTQGNGCLLKHRYTNYLLHKLDFNTWKLIYLIITNILWIRLAFKLIKQLVSNYD